MKLRFVAAVLALVVWSVPVESEAFRFIPFTVEFAPSGPKANQTFKVENNSLERIAVEITIYKRAMAIDGTDQLEEDEEDFVVFPSQIVLEPKEVQAVRVQWVGEAKPESELAYRIIAEQLPIDLAPEERQSGNVRILVRYVGSLYVRPQGVEDDIVIQTAEPTTGAGGEPRLKLSFRNRGRAHAIMRNLELEVNAGGRAITLGPDALGGVTGENILAEHTREFEIPWPDALPRGPISINDLRYNGPPSTPAAPR